MDEQRARQLLLQERTRIQERLDELTAALADPEREAAGELADYDQHQADAGTEAEARERDVTRLDELRAQLSEVERAERRLAESTYGRSVVSGAPIPDERLKAVPTADRTVAEERAAEAERRRPAGTATDDDSTPLDVPGPPPPDLADIPMAVDEADVEYDPQEKDDAVALDMPGEIYRREGAAPAVGRPEPDDALVERTYRPER